MFSVYSSLLGNYNFARQQNIGGGPGFEPGTVESITSFQNIPTQGVEEWFDLRPRSEKSKVKGQVKLKVIETMTGRGWVNGVGGEGVG